MKRKKLVNLLAMSFAILLAFNIYGCNAKSKDKEIVLSTDSSKIEADNEKAIKKYYDEGVKYLENKDYQNAKISFEKAVNTDKSKKDTYLNIKDSYLEINRLDDAYYFINLAIKNKVNTSSMEDIAKDIEGKFEQTSLSSTIKKGATFSLPSSTEVTYNNEKVTDDIKWTNSTIDTSNIGTFTFTGTTAKYNKAVTYTLNIVNPELKHRIGYVSNVYEKDGKNYAVIDLVEFYLYPNAQAEAEKDGFYSESTYGNDYYMRDPDNTQYTFEISSGASISYCDINLSIEGNTDASKSYPIDIATLKNLIIKCNGNTSKNRALLFWFDTEDDVITSMSMQYTP